MEYLQIKTIRYDEILKVYGYLSKMDEIISIIKINIHIMIASYGNVIRLQVNPPYYILCVLMYIYIAILILLNCQPASC